MARTPRTTRSSERARCATLVPSFPHALARGERFGRYVVRAEIGRGSVARVYRAYDPLASRAVAIKLMRTAELPPRTVDLYRRRLGMEGQAAGRLAHPNVVRIYDQGEGFLVMELLDGVLLSRRLRGRRMRMEEALQVLAGIGAALDHAHARGVVHRDVQPRNVVLLVDGTPKLTDFGLAAFAGGDPGVAGKFLGHPSYLAPEHILEGRATALSDLFSLGAIAYEMLTGQRAFPGPSVAAAIDRVVHDQPPPATTVDPRLPPAFDEILARMLDKDPSRRPPNAAAFVAALAAHESPASPRAKGPRPPRTTTRRDPGVQDTLDLGRRARGVRVPAPHRALTVRTDPVGATVWKDGQRMGEAPLTLPLEGGPHVLRVVAKGCVPVQITLDVPAGPAAVLVTLPPRDQATAGTSRDRPDYSFEPAALSPSDRPS